MSWVSCKSCGLDAPSETGITDEEAITYWNTRPAPAATDTGLVTYAHDNGTLSGLSRNEHGPWCLRSQAEAIIAAERAEKEKWKVRGDQHWDTLRSIREMAREGDCERIILWVNDAGSGYTEPLEATVKSLTDKAVALEADNAAQAARIKELEEALDSDPSGSDLWRYWSRKAREASQKYVDEVDRAKALEAKLAAAEKALEQLRSDCQTPIDMYERNGPEFTSPHGNEYESTSYVMAKFAELVASIDEARAVLGGKPS